MLSVAQPALGALLALGGLPDARTVGLGLVAATCGYLAVFSLNDVLDRRADERALPEGKAEIDGYDLDTAYLRHPLACGELPAWAGYVWVAGLAAVAAVIAWVLAPACLVLFAASVALEVVYCLLRSVTWAKTVVSGVMVGVGGLAGWVAVSPLDGRAAAFFAFLALWEVAGRNLPNDLADVEADARVGIRTVATVFGWRASAVATAAGGVATLAALAFTPLPMPAKAASLGFGAWAMAFPAARLAARPSPRLAGEYFNRASLLPALVFLPALAAALVAR